MSSEVKSEKVNDISSLQLLMNVESPCEYYLDQALYNQPFCNARASHQATQAQHNQVNNPFVKEAVTCRKRSVRQLKSIFVQPWFSNSSQLMLRDDLIPFVTKIEMRIEPLIFGISRKSIITFISFDTG